MEEDVPQINTSMPDINAASMPDTSTYSGHSPYPTSTTNTLPEAMNTSDFAPDMSFGLDDNFNWEMIGLGLEEPMPTQQAIDELSAVYQSRFEETC